MGVEETLKICDANNRIFSPDPSDQYPEDSRGDLIRKVEGERINSLPTLFSAEESCWKDPPPVSELPFFKEGLYIIQDEASQLVTSILDPKPGEKILDACAAPEERRPISPRG